MAKHTNREAAERLFAAWEGWDLDTVESLVANDAVDRRPQSGEHFIGRANIMAMYHQVPGPPQIRWQSIRGGLLSGSLRGSSSTARVRPISSGSWSSRTERWWRVITTSRTPLSHPSTGPDGQANPRPSLYHTPNLQALLLLTRTSNRAPKKGSALPCPADHPALVTEDRSAEGVRDGDSIQGNDMLGHIGATSERRTADNSGYWRSTITAGGQDRRGSAPGQKHA
jgi:hypothetical protein